jgi:polyisoprenoid-binding protein YceI
MKFTLATRLTLACIALVISHATNSQDNFSLKTAKATIQGTSSLHDWESDITKIECTGLFQIQHEVLKAVKSMEIKIMVKGIKSTKGKMMDNKTYDAFKFEKNPDIIFTFISAKISVDKPNVATLETTGNVSMAGVTNLITLSAKGKVLTNGDLEFTVSKKIKMSDYKMKQPTAMMGTITVGDEVTVIFDLILTPVTPTAKKS